MAGRGTWCPDAVQELARGPLELTVGRKVVDGSGRGVVIEALQRLPDGTVDVLTSTGEVVGAASLHHPTAGSYNDRGDYVPGIILG